tara:strand:- start:1678 stop:1842 length:165 start_codon:yes stop_codon:yes gene_type:complete
MRFEARLILDVDTDANFLEVDYSDNCRVIDELLQGLIYDTDDIEIINCEVNTHD